jgi:pyruvate dehydrogenase E2 component (dihydrolipoamide acetyltransferase)
LTAATPYLASPYALPYAAAVASPYYAPTYVHAPSPVGVKTVSSPVASVSSVSGPLALPKAISPIRSSVTGAPLLQPFGALTNRDCVTEGGCLVATLKGAGLAKREAEADAEPQLLASAAPYGLNPYFAGVYASGLASPYYAAGALPYTVARTAPAVAYVNQAPVAVAAPAALSPAVTYVKEAIAAPAPVTYVQKAPVAVAAPAPVAVAAPAPVTYVQEAPVVVSAPVRPAVQVPVVEERTRPVTYTHLGAHPIQPTTVLETDSRVVGHKFI